MKALSAEARAGLFWAKVEKTDGCWLWRGAKNENGYGVVKHGHMRKAHRYAYELLVGEIPAGLTLDHLCRVRHCVNPQHLEPVSNRENTLRGEGLAAKNAAKTHCPAGHEYTAGNTYRRKRGGRDCRRCTLDRMRDKRRGNQ